MRPTDPGGIYSAVLYVHGPDAWGAIRSYRSQNPDALAYRLAQGPEWLLKAEVVSPIVIVSMIASVLRVAALVAIDGTVPRRNRVALKVGVGLAVFALAGLMATRPIIDRARPFIGDCFQTGMMRPGAPHRMTMCPEGVLTAGHLRMAALGGLILGIVVAPILRDGVASRAPARTW